MSLPSIPSDRQASREDPTEFNGRPLLTLFCMGAMMLFGLIPIVLAVHMAWAARHWVAVPIEVTSAELARSRSSDEDRVVILSEVRVSYRYRVGDTTYTSDRIGVHLQAADNVGSWHEDWAANLAAPRNWDTSLVAWVDPQHPEIAVLDRSLRWGLLLFHGLFVLLPIYPSYFAARALVAQWQDRRTH